MPFILKTIDGKKTGLEAVFTRDECQRIAEPTHVVEAVNTTTRKIETFRGKHAPLDFSARRRVQILESHGSYFKKGQYGYVISENTYGGMHCQDGVSRKGEVAYLVSKGGRGGALWFSKKGLRFTKARR